MSYESLSIDHPYKKYVSKEAYNYVINHANDEQVALHKLFFAIDTNKIEASWENLRHVDDTLPDVPEEVITLYYYTLNMIVGYDLSGSELREILKQSLEDGKDGSNDEQLHAVQDRLDEMDDSDVKSFWYALGGSAVTTGLAVVGWVVRMFASGTWTLASWGIRAVAANPALGAAVISDQVISRVILPSLAEGFERRGQTECVE